MFFTRFEIATLCLFVTQSEYQMNKGKSIFAQLMSLFPEYTFRQCVARYGGKELDRENGLDWLDSHARWYDPATGRTTTMDPKAEDYPAISPYTWCAGNPIRFTDPTGEAVQASSDSQNAILLTLKPEDRLFVLFDVTGKICKGLMAAHKSESVNYNNLFELVCATELITVHRADRYYYKDADGGIQMEFLNTYYESEYVKDFIEDFTDTSTGEVGKTGVTLLPSSPKSLVSSLDDNIHIVLSDQLSEEGAAENYSHEGNGHALLYVRYHDRKISGHQTNGLKETNQLLIHEILQSLKETFDNMHQH